MRIPKNPNLLIAKVMRLSVAARDSRRWVLIVGLVVATLDLTVCLSFAKGKGNPPSGMLAVSAGDVVVLVEPSSGAQKSISTGPVGWLFPAPGGTLFAPDLVHGKTTVINLRSLAIESPIDGVTMPHFGVRADRYVVVAENILVLSYPERALMKRLEIEFEHPWQVEVHADNTVLAVLERLPDGGGDAFFSIVKLGEGKLVYRRPLSGDVRYFAFSPVLGLVALADAGGRRVLLAEPSTLLIAAEFEVSGRPVDLAFVGGGSTLAVAIEREDGGGELAIWKVKADKDGALQRKKEWLVPLAGAPVRLASSPDGKHVAVGLSTSQLQVVVIDKPQVVELIELGDVPRDVVWCDPLEEGPLLPDWSDDDPPELDFMGID